VADSGNVEKSVNNIIAFDLNFSQACLKAALIDSFLSASVLVGLFYYLNRYTKRRYFSFWTIAWLFHAFWLGLCLGFPETPEHPALVLFKQWCVGASAVFLIWGSAWFLKWRTKPSRLPLFLAFMFVWSYLGAYHFDRIEMEMPVFGLVGVAGLLTAWCFFRFRAEQPFPGAGLLACGFALWSIYIAAYPFVQRSD